MASTTPSWFHRATAKTPNYTLNGIGFNKCMACIYAYWYTDQVLGGKPQRELTHIKYMLNKISEMRHTRWNKVAGFFEVVVNRWRPKQKNNFVWKMSSDNITQMMENGFFFQFFPNFDELVRCSEAARGGCSHVYRIGLEATREL